LPDGANSCARLCQRRAESGVTRILVELKGGDVHQEM
jgi:hypothetical protein